MKQTFDLDQQDILQAVLEYLHRKGMLRDRPGYRVHISGYIQSNNQFFVEYIRDGEPIPEGHQLAPIIIIPSEKKKEEPEEQHRIVELPKEEDK